MRSARSAVSTSPSGFASPPSFASPASASSERIACSVLVVVALAEVHVADVAVGVDQVLGRPVLVPVGVPGAEVVVLDDRVGDPVAADRVLDVAGVLLERELGRVDADDGQPVIAVAPLPGLEVGKRADAVDAGVGPEVDQHDPAGRSARRSRAARRRVLNHSCVPVKSGAGPRSGSFEPAAACAPPPSCAAAWPPRTSARSSATALELLELAARVDEDRRQVVGDRVLEA